MPRAREYWQKKFLTEANRAARHRRALVQVEPRFCTQCSARPATHCVTCLSGDARYLDQLETLVGRLATEKGWLCAEIDQFAEMLAAARAGTFGDPNPYRDYVERDWQISQSVDPDHPYERHEGWPNCLSCTAWRLVGPGASA